MGALTDASGDTAGDMMSAMPEELKEREARLAIRILEQTAIRPQPPASSPDIDLKLRVWTQDAINELPSEQRENFRGASGEAEAIASCRVYGTLITLISNADPDDAADIYKAFLQKGADWISG
jgi:hypothetical protein